MKLKNGEETLTMAAAKAGMDRKTARKYLKLGLLPSQCAPERTWRTRADPFEEVWPEVERILDRAPSVEATTLFDHLCRVHEGCFQEGQLRTLQRRVKDWRVRFGEPKEVMFAQTRRPGEQGQSDFTWMRKLGVTIAGQPFEHLLYHFVLAYSNWEAITICSSESFESLSKGLQNALWELGAVPREHRTDRLSSAVNNNLQREEFTQRYQGLLKHYGLEASYSQAGRAHENGDVEQAHRRFKKAVDQELLLRGGRDFQTVDEYRDFLAGVARRRNAMRSKRLKEELAAMRPLPAGRIEDFTRLRARVSGESLIRVRRCTYSVDSRLIGEQVEVRVHADHLEIYHGGRQLARMARLRGRGGHDVDYRHAIHSLVRKPGAFARYRYREDLFPGLLFRMAYDELRESCPASADRQYLRILEMAALNGQRRVEGILKALLEESLPIRETTVRERLHKPDQVEPWKVRISAVEPAGYDALLSTGEAAP